MTFRFSHRLIAIGVLALLAVSVIPAYAQEVPPPNAPEECVEQIRDRLRQQRRVWHGVLYGVKKAEDLREGSVRYDEAGIPWIRTGEGRWVTSAKEFAATQRTNAQVDATTEWTGMNEPQRGTNDLQRGDTSPRVRSERLGIFERKGAVTTQLVPDIIAGLRDFECRAAMVCEAARATLFRQETDIEGFLRVSTPGCEELIARPLDRCRFGDAYQKNQATQLDVQIDETAPSTQCTFLARQLVLREASMARIAVSYDAAYRSLLQFAGAFDGFLRVLRGDLLGPIEYTVPLLNALSRVSCFAAQCNE